MAGGKQTPRQKLIGMMYLVLMAMLALNVSKSVLDAFVLIDDGLMQTTLSFVAKNQLNYEIFEAQFEQSPNRVGPYRESAHEVKRMADQLTFELQELKVQIVQETDGQRARAITPMDWTVGIGSTAERRETFNVNADLIQGKDNKFTAGTIMIHGGKGEELKQKFEEFREFLVSLVDNEGVRQGIEDVLNTEPRTSGTGQVEPWVIRNFDHLPMVAVIVNLTRMQSDVRRAEADAVDYLLNRIGATDTRVNRMEAIVLSRSNFVLQGNEWQGRVLLAAYDSLQRPEIMLGQFRRNAENTDYEMVGDSQLLTYDAQGRAMIRRTATTPGTFPIQGLLRMSTPDGFRHFPFRTEYQVGAPMATISATAMNVLYRGIPNPISIGVSGVPAETVNATISNGTLTRAAGGGWNALPGAGAEAVITVTATVDGQTRQMGNMQYRVQSVPDPIARVSGRTGGRIPRAELAASQGVEAAMVGFMFDLRYTVTGFNMLIATPQGELNLAATSFAFTQAQRDAINRQTRGTNVVFTNITASNPQLGTRNLMPIVLTID